MKLWAICLLAFQITTPVTELKIPDSPGVHYRQEGGKWMTLASAPVVKTTTKGLPLFVETGGYTNLETEVRYSGARASVRIIDSRPVFYVRGVSSSEQALLIQLAKKGENRVFRKSSANSTVENGLGVRKDIIRDIVKTVLLDDLYSISPKADLKPGEFLLIFGDATESYDFGIDSKR